MPRIPNETAFGARPTPGVVRSIADPGSSPIGSALNQLGETFYAEGKRKEQAANRIEYAKAKSLWLQGKVRLDNNFKNDNDYKTFEERYTQGLADVEAEATSIISDPDTLALFESEIAFDRAAGIEKIKTLSFTKETDVEIAALNQILTDNKDAAVLADTNTRAAILEANAEHIGAAVERGYLTETQAQKLRESVTQDYLISLLKTKTPEQQLTLLKNDETMRLLPADVYQQTLLQAKEASVLSASQRHADRILAEDPDRAAALAEVAKISDPEERKQTRTEVVFRLGQQETAKSERQYEIASQFLTGLSDGVPIREQARNNQLLWDELDGQTRVRLLSMDSEKTRTTNLAAYAKANDLMADQGAEAARQYLHANWHEFSDSDFKKLEDRFVKEDAPETTLTITQYIKSLQDSGAIRGDRDRGKLQRAFDEWELEFIQSNNKEPTLDERKRAVDDLLYEQKGKGLFGLGAKALFELPLGERRAAMGEAATARLDEQIQSVRDEISAKFEAQTGRKPSPEEINAIMSRMGEPGG